MRKLSTLLFVHWADHGIFSQKLVVPSFATRNSYLSDEILSSQSFCLIFQEIERFSSVYRLMPEKDLRFEAITSQILEAVMNIREHWVRSYYFVGKVAELLKIIKTQAAHYFSC